jgi:hypothetical protein
VTKRTPRRHSALLAACFVLSACAGTPEESADPPDLGRGAIEASKSMARAVTGGAAAFGRGVGTAYGGVRQGFQEPAGDAAYGPYPKNYVDLVKKHFTRVLRYPEAANYTLGKPARGYMNQGLLRGGGVAWQGWLVDVEVQTVQSVTGHRAARSYVVRIRDGEIIEVHQDPSLLRRL